MDRPCRDGADRAERQKSALLLLLLGRLLLLRHRVTSLRTARPAVGSILGATLRGAREGCQGENTLWRGFLSRSPHIWGVVCVALLANRRRLAVLATAYELLIQRHALLAHRTLLGRIGGEVAAHEAKDLLSRDLRLLRAAPERPDADDLAAQLLHEIAEQLHRAPRADEILHDQNLRARADEAVELRGQGDLALARAHALGPVH